MIQPIPAFDALMISHNGTSTTFDGCCGAACNKKIKFIAFKTYN
jgi:hypothetical protein